MKKILFVLLYSSIYILIHVNYLTSIFGYLGYLAFDHDFYVYITTYLFILLPLILNYTKNQSLSFFFIISYTLLYIPIIITTMYQHSEVLEVYYYQFIFGFSYFIIFFIPKFYSKEISYEFRKEDKTLGSVFLIIWCTISSLFLLIIYRDSINFVSFENVYSHRGKYKVIFPMVNYLILWNVYLFGPLTIIKSLKEKKNFGVLVGFFAIVIIYGINSSKIVLFIPALVVGAYFLLKLKKNIFKYFLLGFSFLMLLLYKISNYFFVLSAVILMRTFGITGLLTYQYEKFFQNNPNTYYSHINFVNKFIYEYPYNEEDLGKVVSRYFISDSESNSNANFWATDGFASLDELGVIIISIILGFFLLFWKKMINNSNYLELNLMLVPFSFIILNVGFFTSILSGGYLFFLFYYFYNKKIKKI